MTKIVSIFVIALLSLQLFSGCSKTNTVTVTLPAVTVTQPAVTITQTPVAVTQPAVTVTLPPATVTQPPVTVTVTPTWIPNPYRSNLACNYEGTVLLTGYINGTFNMAIDENGDISGTFSGIYTGSIRGEVDLLGNLVALSILESGNTPVGSSWEAKLKRDGKAMSVSGNWSSTVGSGTFSGTGTVSY